MKIKITKKLIKEADEKRPGGTEKFVSKHAFDVASPRRIDIYQGAADPTQKQSEEEIKKALEGEMKDPSKLEQFWSGIKKYFGFSKSAEEPKGEPTSKMASTPKSQPKAKSRRKPGKINLPDPIRAMPKQLAPPLSQSELDRLEGDNLKRLQSIEKRFEEDPLDVQKFISGDPDFEGNFEYDRTGRIKRPKGVMRPLQEIAKRHFKTDK